MTSFTSDDGVEHFIFGKDGAKNICANLKIELLGKIPIEVDVRKGCDTGLPYMNMSNKTTTSEEIYKITNLILNNLDKIK